MLFLHDILLKTNTLKSVILLLFALLVIFSCKKEVQQNTVPTTETKKVEETLPQLSKNDSVKILNDEILQILKVKNYTELEKFIHPEKGVRFSIYAYIDANKDKKFSKTEFEKYADSNIKFTWGETDGEGKPVVMSIKNYLDNWVFKKDFSQSKFSLNEFQGSGNSLNNLQKVYPQADFTENYIAGTEQYGGMDWKTLRFVFEKSNGKYFLVAVINDEWTI